VVAAGRGAAGRQVAGAPVEADAPPATRATGPGRAKASPLARRLATELGVDLGALAGSGPQGRVIRADVERSLAANGGGSDGREAAPAPDPTAPASGEQAASVSEQAASVSEQAKGESAAHELTRVQRLVARRMAESRATIPDIELRAEVDMSEAVALRERLREVADPAPSFNDFIVRAVALALREFPRVNGAYRDAKFETYSRVNVGIAVAAEDALVVPTILDADRKSLREIGEAARRLASRVRDGSISPAELAGGTFTVSNLGMYGIDSFSAVINPPQAAILAVGALKRRPVVDEGSGDLVARPTVTLTLACDHRIVYGVDGARFLTRVRELLERPHALLM
jgi:pyruvate dehydrogenase E2 component (dihydrolipoamide acetyltransferase)